jgi:hypothetical protein
MPPSGVYREGFKNRNMARRRPEFEPGLAGAEAAKLNKFSDAGGTQIQWLPDAARTDFSITSGIAMDMTSITPEYRASVFKQALEIANDRLKTHHLSVRFFEQWPPKPNLCTGQKINSYRTNI